MKQETDMQTETETETKPGGAHCAPWGTLEELLLACAVNKHGTTNWNSIVSELQTKTSSLLSLTSQHCIEKFNDLKRRFISQNDVVLVDELRKLRVQELKRQLHRHDVSIVSLETKVKRLEEERERSLRNEGIDDSPGKEVSPEKLVAGEDSDRSVNESNSTSQQKAQNVDEKTVVKTEPENETEPVRTGSGMREMQNWSHNGKLKDDDEENNVENNRKIIILGIGERKKKEKMTIKLNRTGDFGSGGLVSESNNNNNNVNNSNINNNESVVESKKQNTSDVQSSVSLSLNKKKRRRRSGALVGSSSEEPDEVSPAKRVSVVKSEPLNNLLGVIRAHRLGSTFERRLRSQESEHYKSLIRQHVDLRMVQSRLDKGIYSNCIHKFFRDLLLLFNNAVLFFRKNSPENLAAKELRAIVRKEMTQRLTKPKPQPGTAKAEPKIQPLSFSKPNKASTMVVCGKRSSMKAISGNSSKKGEKKDREVGEKPKANEEKIESSFEDNSTRKKWTKERSVSGLRNKSSTKNNNGEIKHQYGGNELSSHDGLDVKLEKKESTARKKQGAANFLKRMKQNSLSEVTENEGNHDDSSSENESKDSKRKEEEKKKKGGQSKEVTERVTRSTRGRGGRGEGGRGKKTIGRPPKKQAEASGGGGKRGRDNGDSEVAGSGGGGSGGRAKKMTRR